MTNASGGHVRGCLCDQIDPCDRPCIDCELRKCWCVPLRAVQTANQAVPYVTQAGVTSCFPGYDQDRWSGPSGGVVRRPSGRRPAEEIADNIPGFSGVRVHPGVDPADVDDLREVLDGAASSAGVALALSAWLTAHPTVLQALRPLLPPDPESSR